MTEPMDSTLPQEKTPANGASSETCIFCTDDPNIYRYVLHESELFRVMCDVAPIAPTHLLIIPKKHVSCIGAYDSAQLAEFKQLYQRFSAFVAETHGAVATFEHGIFGQTVFHSHVHILPFSGTPDMIVPEGANHFRPAGDLESFQTELMQHQGYLFFSIGDNKWLVDTALAIPRFFRDRFATALGTSHVADWKAIRGDESLIKQLNEQNQSTIQEWHSYDAKVGKR